MDRLCVQKPQEETQTAGKVCQLKCQEQTHENEDIIAICTKKDCQFSSRLMCLSCLTSEHCDHGRYGMKLNEFNPSRSCQEITLNWKGDSDLPQKMIAGLKQFQKEIDIGRVNKELDEFENEILKEIKDIRKQILSNLYIKKEQGDEEYIKVVQQLGEFLQIQKMQHLLQLPSIQDISENSTNNNNNNNNNNEMQIKRHVEIEEKIEKIIGDLNDKNRKEYIECIDLMCNSECIYSYSLNVDVIKEQSKIIKQHIQDVSSKIHKITQSYFFQSSLAYDSKNTIQIRDNNTSITFTNLSSYSVAYLNTQFKLEQKPIQIHFQFEQVVQTKQHFCIGLRRENLKDEDSYNKNPYKCLHCNIGDGILYDSGIHTALAKHDILIANFNPQSKSLSIHTLNDKIICNLGIPPEEKNQNNVFRLYFWRGGSQIQTKVKIIKVI